MDGYKITKHFENKLIDKNLYIDILSFIHEAAEIEFFSQTTEKKLKIF